MNKSNHQYSVQPTGIMVAAIAAPMVSQEHLEKYAGVRGRRPSWSAKANRTLDTRGTAL